MLPLSSFLYLASGADRLEHTPHVTSQRVRCTATISATTGVLVLMLTVGEEGVKVLSRSALEEAGCQAGSNPPSGLCPGGPPQPASPGEHQERARSTGKLTRARPQCKTTLHVDLDSLFA